MDYSKGKIYCLKSCQTNDIYYGSTADTLYKRLSCHKRDYKAYLKGIYHYVSSYEIVKYNDCYIELFENYPCLNRDELRQREGEIIKSNKCVNKCIPGRTNKEYCEDNKDKIAEHKKQYREDNKKQFAEQKKEYYEDNKNTIIEKTKAYYEKNKDTILEKLKEKFECECGGKFTHQNKSTHLKTVKHQNYEIANNSHTPP